MGYCRASAFALIDLCEPLFVAVFVVFAARPRAVGSGRCAAETLSAAQPASSLTVQSGAGVLPCVPQRSEVPNGG
jgi:hypothetical protein